jgi:hypothetical protein
MFVYFLVGFVEMANTGPMTGIGTLNLPTLTAIYLLRFIIS